MKKLAIAFTLLLASVASFAQDREDREEDGKGFQRNRLFVGGNFGLSFGSYTFINVSPQVGYHFTDHFAAGAGVNFQYAGLKEEDGNGRTVSKTSQGVAGLNVFGRVYPIRQFMFQVQPEANYVFGKDVLYYTDPRQEYKFSKIVPSLLAGGGLVLPSGRGAMIVSVFYDVLQRPNSPYFNKPIFNFTFNAGL
ncbi:hypothetical protein V9K67_15040 [Paraflavisolibacter sp. H34]|uniref:hypothetical protein n=1 Tax=Huijunlia imazamoxiresistens TaxID=3127457 RepID=UPI00301764B2